MAFTANANKYIDKRIDDRLNESEKRIARLEGLNLEIWKTLCEQKMRIDNIANTVDNHDQTLDDLIKISNADDEEESQEQIDKYFAGFGYKRVDGESEEDEDDDNYTAEREAFGFTGLAVRLDIIDYKLKEILNQFETLKARVP
jgi:hypothetical protein